MITLRIVADILRTCTPAILALMFLSLLAWNMV